MTLKISSCPSSIQKVENFVQDLRSRLDIKDDKYCNILISLTEAVNNAIHHGNNLDESKFVIVQTGYQGSKLLVSISDEGRGFDPSAVADPTCSENICECGGRGVFLIKQLADEVHYLNNGSTVRLSFHI
jgi:serine/threonine-protein kinase RsbW